MSIADTNDKGTSESLKELTGHPGLASRLINGKQQRDAPG